MVLRDHLRQLPQPLRHGIKHRVRRIQLRLLRNVTHGEVRRAPDHTVVQLNFTGDDLQQTALAAAVTPDQTGPLPGVKRQPHGCQQRMKTVSECGVVESDERHRSTPEARRAF